MWRQGILPNPNNPAMRKFCIPLLSAALLCASCSDYRQFNAVVAGSSVGGMFGSSIGGIIGGPRGYDVGNLTGMVVGGAIGAAVTQPKSSKSEKAERRSDDDVYRFGTDDVQYDTYKRPKYTSPAAALRDVEYLEVTNLHFLDSNDNHCLDNGEEAMLVMDIYNRGDRTLYNIAPQITCSSKRVAVSPAATVSALPAGQGIRYKAMVKAVRRIKDGWVVFDVSFGKGKQAVRAKQFKRKTTK